MYRVDNATAITPIPAPAAVGPNPNSFYTKGNPGLGIPATVVDDDALNAMQEEICGVIEGAGIVLDKTKRNQLLAALQGKLARNRLTANTTFFVNIGTGNNANSGLAIGTPWQTLQFAWDTLVSSYDLNGFVATIQLADGAYGTGVFKGMPPGANKAGGTAIVLNGNAVTPANVTTGQISVSDGTEITLQNFKVIGANSGILAGQLSLANLGAGMILASTGSASIDTRGGLVFINNNMSISGNNLEFVNGLGAGSTVFIASGITLTFTGTPVYSSALFALAELASCHFGGAVTFTGAVTGVQYACSTNAVLNKAGSTIAGTAGTTSTGAQVV